MADKPKAAEAVKEQTGDNLLVDPDLIIGTALEAASKATQDAAVGRILQAAIRDDEKPDIVAQRLHELLLPQEEDATDECNTAGT